ncbi:hypothetical protein [Lysinibacillus xylanilyticus]|uniref:hypothetical protein n=1 Tax=Lysinibacillus xylanilyticus TaxID=582475 RepID=UPI0036DAB0DA
MVARCIDEVKNPVIKKVEKIVFADRNKIEIHFPNGKHIELSATSDYGGDDPRIIITKEA